MEKIIQKKKKRRLIDVFNLNHKQVNENRNHSNKTSKMKNINVHIKMSYVREYDLKQTIYTIY